MAQLALQSGARPDGELTPLLRQLIAYVAPDGESPSGNVDESGGVLLLDVELDGARYLLTRLPNDPPLTASLLSPREQEIVRMVSQGFTNKAIASVLEISTWTVSTHLRRVFAKIGVSTRAAMVAKMLHPPAEGPATPQASRR